MKTETAVEKRRKKPQSPEKPSLRAQNLFLREMYDMMLNDAGAQKLSGGWLGG